MSRPGTSLPAALFPADPDPPKCSARGCPGRKSLCKFDADQDKGLLADYATRPRTCLNGAQNRDGIPYA